MTGSNKEEKPRTPWKTAVHMIAFGMLLALILLLVKGPPVDFQDGGRVVFTEADLAHVHATFERTWNRPPSATELRTAFDRYVRDEVFYQEALAQELDRNDPIIKTSLVRKITMLGTAMAQAEEPTDEEIKAYFELRTERYRIPASFDLIQVFLNPDKHAENLFPVTEKILAELRTKDPKPEEVVEMGDTIMLPSIVRDMSEDDLTRTFGNEFRDATLSLSIGRWEGPIRSAYGLHLVKITNREDSGIPDWTKIKDRLINDMQFEGRKASEDQFYAEILPRYEVVFTEALKAVLEGDEGQGRPVQ